MSGGGRLENRGTLEEGVLENIETLKESVYLKRYTSIEDVFENRENVSRRRT